MRDCEGKYKKEDICFINYYYIDNIKWQNNPAQELVNGTRLMMNPFTLPERE